MYRLDLDNPKVLDLLHLHGIPYSYGAGAPSDGNAPTWNTGAAGLQGGIGYDCSGLAQVCLVRLGLLPATAPDRSAQSLYNKCTILPDIAQAQLGDLVFYGKGDHNISHVTVYLGDSLTLGADGGSSTTNADDPKAFVKLAPYNYRSDIVNIGKFNA